MTARTTTTHRTRRNAGHLLVGTTAALALAAAPVFGVAHARAPADLVQQDGGDTETDTDTNTDTDTTTDTDTNTEGAPSIEPGDDGRLVAWWQDRLNTWIELSEFTNDPLEVDGRYGDRSQWLTLMFQQNTDGVPVDGIIDPEDRVALHEAIEALLADGAPSIERGDRTELAAWWQERLNTWIELAEDTPDPIVVDGWYGPNTEQATIEFQEAVDAVEADGVVDPADRVALAERIDALETADGAPPVEPGDRGRLAAWWQDRLNTWIALSGASIDPLVVDGWYGPNSEAATRVFQDRVAAVPTDGIVNPEDRVALSDAIAAESGQDGDDGQDENSGQDGEEPQGFTTETQTSDDFPATGDTKYLTEILFSSDGDVDQLNFRFEGSTGDLSYDVGYVDAAEAPSGDAVEVDGEVVLRVAMSPASGVDLTGDTAEETYTAPDRFDTETLSSVNEVALAEDFEAMMTWAVGLDAERPFRVEVGENPLTLVVEIDGS